MLLTLVYPPTIVTFLTSLFAALLAGGVALCRGLGRLFGASATIDGDGEIRPARLAIGVYGISVLCRGVAGQLSGGWYPLGPFALASWPALLLPLPLFAVARRMLRRR